VQYGAMEESGTADRAYGQVGGQAKIQSRFTKQTELNEYWIDYARETGYVLTMEDKELGCYPLECTKDGWGRIKPTVPLNYHVQGTAMWCMGRAMVRCHNYLNQLNGYDQMQDAIESYCRRDGYHLVMQVHDELVFDFPSPPRDWKREPYKFNLPKIRKIKRLMEQSGDDIGVPLPVEVDYHPYHWAHAEGISL